LLQVEGTDNLPCMEALTNFTWSLRIWKDSRGQDLVEYALLAGFLAVSAGAILGSVADDIRPMLSKVISVVAAAADAGQQLALPTGAPVSTK
jgi:pilus assembly protein Flp/PilA